MGFFLLDDTDHTPDTHDYAELANKVNNMLAGTSQFDQMVKLINQIVDQDTTNHNTPASEFDWGVSDQPPA